MRRLSTTRWLAVLLLSFSGLAWAAEPQGLDALLQQVQQAAGQDAKLNAEREQRFLADKNQQAAMVGKAEADLAQAKAKADAVRARFAANQKAIADLKDKLKARAGDYIQVQGAVKEAAGAFRAIASESLVSAQVPDRMPTLDALADQDGYPSVADLEHFWVGLQQELVQGGRIARFTAPVVDADGKRESREVIRIGSFTAFSGGHYLVFDPQAGALTELTRQPSHHWRALAADFADAKDDGRHEAMIDPSHGSLLVQEALRPTLRQRIAQGGTIAYVIITIGVFGAALAVWQLVFLLRTGRRVRAQLGDIGHPRTDNPLGRVLAAFRGDAAAGVGDGEVLELRLSEAILREIPALERFQPLLRLIIAAGPLLGLVGTVTGMIITFQVIQEQGAGDPRLMAGGISQAMITTVLGLGVAVPMLFINAILSARSRVLVQILDEQSAGLLARHIETQQEQGDAPRA
ncbi:MotA/TolQ/ExbB proton channel family protein [Solimonas marina]|uniref:MotA/TolQ/ExbB proton channel family protein n=1 Tax=Solimonas marina TaxID=2714601 RepID=A0A970B9W8_9GAMM|nr:MotA/TolQ/ExbB proton channel family protein [Solimonas marina]NKF23784.1 MotA/TolQ/ExbB proton channel family protein [Solimonas marina]